MDNSDEQNWIEMKSQGVQKCTYWITGGFRIGCIGLCIRSFKIACIGLDLVQNRIHWIVPGIAIACSYWTSGKRLDSYFCLSGLK